MLADHFATCESCIKWFAPHLSRLCVSLLMALTGNVQKFGTNFAQPLLSAEKNKPSRNECRSVRCFLALLLNAAKMIIMMAGQ